MKKIISPLIFSLLSVNGLLWAAVCENQDYKITADISSEAIDAGYEGVPLFVKGDFMEILIKKDQHTLRYKHVLYSANGAGDSSYQALDQERGLWSFSWETVLSLYWYHEGGIIEGYFIEYDEEDYISEGTRHRIVEKDGMVCNDLDSK